MKFKVRVVPNAKKTECVGALGDAVKIKVCAPPIDGKANVELTAFVAKKLGLPRRATRVVCGETSRDKIIEAETSDVLTMADIIARLSAK